MLKSWMYVVVAVALGLTLAGCESSGTKAAKENTPTLKLSRSSNTVLVGETTTLFANTANLLGRDANIRWSTTLGQIQAEQGGRIARFHSDVPGTAVVTAELNVDGRILRDQTNVTVSDIPGHTGAAGARGSSGATTAPSDNNW